MTVYNDRDGKPLRLHAIVRHVSRPPESVELVRYEDERRNVFGGAAARDDVRVDENGIYRPLPPTGTFSS